MTDSGVTTLSIIGFGRVGRALAFLLNQSAGPLWVNLVDPELNRGAYEDILHSFWGRTGHRFTVNDQARLRASQVIFHCAGPSVPHGQSRLAVARSSAELTSQIFAPLDLSEASPLVIVLANPVDLISWQLSQLAGLAPSQVIGTGTLLDSWRLNSLLDRHLGLVSGQSQAVLLGEHGNSMALWSEGSKVAGRPLEEAVPPTELDDLLQQTRQMAHLIKHHQGATYYGVASCALHLWRAVRSTEPCVLPASVEVPEPLLGQLEVDPLFLSLPVELGNGQLRVSQQEFRGEDLERLKASAQQLAECRATCH